MMPCLKDGVIFRKFFSYDDAQQMRQNFSICALDQRKQIDIILLDFAKLSIPYPTCVYLRSYNGFNWIRTWLTDRTQRVLLRNVYFYYFFILFFFPGQDGLPLPTTPSTDGTCWTTKPNYKQAKTKLI